MVILDAERDVRTPVGAVWRALVDYPRYPKWTGAAILQQDPDRPGELVYRIRVRTPGRTERAWSFPGRETTREPLRAIGWRFGMGFVYGLDIGFETSARGGVTHVRHFVRITGLVAVLRPALLRRIFGPVVETMLSDLEAEARRRQRRGA
ncbi:MULTISPECIES: SRPBCC family protein [Caulobacteraceae]|uniref:SRPBCC family protein n=1 Tax=Caulobacteraceae TaxID=76892 RepID=UPI00082D748F|nr:MULTISPECIES: SRPBCC family protein [Caulobacteraceae]ODT86366.1 MAG: hypothetical protein ABS78_16980 [Phenylobacterium sp. SCN 70-31]